MKTNQDSWKKQGIHLLLKRNDLWVKNTLYGPESLMLALSNSLYLTGVHAKALENRIIDFLRENYAQLRLKTISKKDFDMQAYLTNPRDSKYESLNLELAAHMLKRRIKLLSIADDNLNCETFYSKTDDKLSLFKFSDYCYAALFDKNLKPVYALAQQLVYSVVSKALSLPSFSIDDGKQPHFRNIEYEIWKTKNALENNSEQLEQNAGNYSFNDSIVKTDGNNNSYSLVFSEQFSNVSNSRSLTGVNVTELLANRSKFLPANQPHKLDNPKQTNLSQLFNTESYQNINRIPIKPEIDTIPVKVADEEAENPQIGDFKARIHEENFQLNQAVPLSVMDCIMEESELGCLNSNHLSAKPEPLVETLEPNQENSYGYMINIGKNSQLSVGDPSFFLEKPNNSLNISNSNATPFDKSKQKNTIVLKAVPDPFEYLHLPKDKHETFQAELNHQSDSRQLHFGIDDSLKTSPKSFAFNLGDHANSELNRTIRDSGLNSFNRTTTNILRESSPEDHHLSPQDTNIKVQSFNPSTNIFEQDLQGKTSETCGTTTPRTTGKLTFYDPLRCFGLIRTFEGNSHQTVFVFKADIEKSGLTVDDLLASHERSGVILSFEIDSLPNQSSSKRKATNIKLQVLL